MSTANYQWQPGNGTNYDITIGITCNRVLLCWMMHSGSGGVCMWFKRGGFLDWTYMSEKLGVNAADSAGILALVHQLKLSEVGMPHGYGLDGLDDAHRKLKENPAGPWAEHAHDVADAYLASLKPPRDYASQPSAEGLELIYAAASQHEEEDRAERHGGVSPLERLLAPLLRAARKPPEEEGWAKQANDAADSFINSLKKEE